MVNFGSDIVESLALVVELPMLAFHVSVTVFIAGKVRRLNEAFDKVFYKLYLIYCASNYMRYFTVSEHGTKT
ncbi:hypothetical protein AAVH_28386 [Aphelenchoides avenae]|nr:hypothetical protein AAVH_28386 [Aphelenchus avenae]